MEKGPEGREGKLTPPTPCVARMSASAGAKGAAARTERGAFEADGDVGVALTSLPIG